MMAVYTYAKDTCFLNAGINLGSSLDAFEAGKTGLETETCWENPVVTKVFSLQNKKQLCP